VTLSLRDSDGHRIASVVTRLDVHGQGQITLQIPLHLPALSSGASKSEILRVTVEMPTAQGSISRSRTFRVNLG
jgi:hypothetical protein